MQRGFKYYLSEYKNDLPAALVVFLVALPLCLGIALASGAPLFSGIITGIIGGIVVGTLSGSHTSVSGPAAGLTVIVLGAISSLSSFELFLTAVVIAGVLQLILGYVKAGIIGLYFPSSVIKGMLAAIGLILILKQLPHFLGFDVKAFGAIGGQETMLSKLLAAVQHIHAGAALIGVVSLVLLILWEQPFIKNKPFAKIIPGALVAVIAGVLLNLAFIAFAPNMAIQSGMLVSLPLLNSVEAFKGAFTFPDLSGFLNPLVWQTAFVIAIVASLETLLSIEAVDKLDPLKRHTPNNRELKAQGVGNIISGLVGGLPLTAVIVRSSANIQAGGKTKMSAIYHGVFLLLSVLLIPTILNFIPLASLAAVLLMVGWKLSKPALYVEQWKIGKNQFIPFIVTILAILFTDLLVGILIGMSVGIFFILRANYKTPYFYQSNGHNGNGQTSITIFLSEHVSFINKASLQLTLDHLPDNSHVIIDGSRSTEIDPDALEIIHNFTATAKDRNIDLTLVRVPSHPVLNLN